MKKKLCTILLIITCFNASATTRYFATTGSDLTGTGTLAFPYASLGKAASVSVAGDDIQAGAGTFTQTTQVILAAGVNVDGAGKTATRINLSYFVSGSNTFNQGAVQMLGTTEAASPATPAATISDIWFDGGFTCLTGILVRARSNVTFDRCNFSRFGTTALSLNGKYPTNATGVNPGTFSINNSVLNCTFTDCSDRQVAAANSVSTGSISYSGQSNLLFQYDTLSNTTNPLGLRHNGNLFGAVQGNNKGVRWLNNVLTKPQMQDDDYNFVIESWYDKGGCEFAYNTIVGGGNIIDIGYGGANKGSDAYSWYIHHNTLINPGLTTYLGNNGTTGSIFVQFEPTTNTTLSPPVAQQTQIGDAIIEYNYIKNGATLVQIVLNNFASDWITDVNINHNVCEDMGYANGFYNGVFNFTIRNGARIDSIFIDNNTLLSTPSSKAIMILQPDVGIAKDIYFRNNVAMTTGVPTGYGYILFRGNYATDRVFSQNNITFQNAFTNNPYTIFTYTAGAGNFIVGKSYTIVNVGTTDFTLVGASSNTAGVTFTATGAGAGTGSATFNFSNITPTNFTNTGNLKVNPQFVAPNVPRDLHLAAGSPGIAGGLNPPATYIGAYPPGGVTPTITWAPTSITYGATFAASMTATTGVAGTFAYTNGATTLNSSSVLNAGTYSLLVTFTPTDPVTYNSTSKTVTFTVNQAAATLSYNIPSLTQTYNGSPLQPVVTTTATGVSVISTTYNGLGAAPTLAGVYTVISGLTNPNFTAPTITNTFTITKATVTINAVNETVNYDGLQHSITATTTPSVPGLVVTYDGSSTPSSALGVHAVHITLVNPNYQATPVDVTLTIVSNPAIIFISDTTKIYSGLAQPVTVTTPYTYDLTYNGSVTVPSLAGTYIVIATINDGVHSGADTAVLTIAKRQAVLSWTQPNPKPYGAMLTILDLNATADISGTFSYSYPVGTVLQIGVTGMTATFTPTDTANFTGGTVSTTISVYGVNPFLDYFISANGRFFFIEQ